jgi:DNA-binding CsgD family transcriptional regulator
MLASKGLDEPRLDSLGVTRRETEVLRWLAAGKTDREIGKLLGCSHRTVQKHLQRLYVKLGVETRVAAVMRALGS